MQPKRNASANKVSPFYNPKYFDSRFDCGKWKEPEKLKQQDESGRPASRAVTVYTRNKKVNEDTLSYEKSFESLEVQKQKKKKKPNQFDINKRNRSPLSVTK